MNLSRLHSSVEKEIRQALRRIDRKDFDNLYDNIINSERIFITGMGRSGLIGQIFAMRLMHLGFKPFIIGESITPRMEKDDLLIAVSGTGESKVTNTIARAAKMVKTKVLAITGGRNNTLSRIADRSMVIPYAKTAGKKGSSMQPLGTLFEQCVYLLFDLLVLYIINRTGKNEYGLLKRHTQL